MQKKIILDYSYAFPFINEGEISKYQNKASDAMDILYQRKGAGNDFLGWIDLAEKMINSAETKEIIETGKEIYSNGDLFICIGIGGSYLGAKAVTEALLNPLHNFLDDNHRKGPKLFFAGHNISGAWLDAILHEMDKSKSIYINVISKSGTTTEPGVAFRNIKQKMEQKYGKNDSTKRIIATTDSKRGALRKLSEQEGYKIFIIPDDVGGRFSVLTPVGLLPIAGTGIDIMELLNGALQGISMGRDKDMTKNPALAYAIIRNLFLQKGFHTEIMVNYEPSLHFFSEWWKQLYGESEGKNGKGIFPASVDFTTDLHSLGQWIQDGQRFIFETVLDINEETSSLKVASDKANLDGLEYLAGKTYFEINKNALKATLLAHYEGKVPNLVFNIPSLDAFYMGELIYIFEEACGISGYLLGVNPFDQPGVEAYKKNMFALLNKPGEAYEKARIEIEQKIKNLPKGKITQ